MCVCAGMSFHFPADSLGRLKSGDTRSNCLEVTVTFRPASRFMLSENK